MLIVGQVGSFGAQQYENHRPQIAVVTVVKTGQRSVKLQNVGRRPMGGHGACLGKGPNLRHDGGDASSGPVPPPWRLVTSLYTLIGKDPHGEGGSNELCREDAGRLARQYAASKNHVWKRRRLPGSGENELEKDMHLQVHPVGLEKSQTHHWKEPQGK